MRRCKTGLAVLVILTTALFGCTKGPTVDEAQVRGVVEAYLNAMAARDFNTALSLVSGDAAQALQQLTPALEALNYSTQISDVKTSVVRSSDQDVEVEASYVQHQTLPDLGSTVTQYRTRYWLAPVDGKWRIYRVALVDKEDQQSR